MREFRWLSRAKAVIQREPTPFCAFVPCRFARSEFTIMADGLTELNLIDLEVQLSRIFHFSEGQTG